MTINIRCDSCDAAYKVPDKLAGKKAKCKKCGHTMNIASAAHRNPSAAIAKLNAVCGHCGASYSVGASVAGKRVKCKKCGGVFQVPNKSDAQPTAVDAPTVAAVADDPLGDLNMSDWGDPLDDPLGDTAAIPGATTPSTTPTLSQPMAAKPTSSGVPKIVWIAAGGGGALLITIVAVVLVVRLFGGGGDPGVDGAGQTALSSGPNSPLAGGRGNASDGESMVDELPPLDDSIAWTWRADPPRSAPAGLLQQPLKLVDRPNETFFAGGVVAQAVLSYRRGSGAQSEVLVQRLDLRTGKAIGEHSFTRNTKLLDLSRDGTSFLILPGANYASNETLQVWRWDGTAARQVGEWTPYSDQNVKRIAWSMMVDADRVATGHGQEKIARIWNASGRQVNRFQHEGGRPPRLSPGGKYLVQHSGIWLRFFDSATLKHVGSIGPLSADYVNFNGIAYHPDGRSIAATFQHPGGTTFVAWKASDRQQLAEFEIPILSSPMKWAADDFVLAGGYLVSVSNEMPVWYYSGLKPFDQQIDLRVWHHLSVGNEQYLAATDFPSSDVRSKIDEYVAANVPVLRSGDKVSMSVDVVGPTPKPDMQQQLTQMVTTQLKTAGYTVEGSQPYQLRVTLEDKDSGRQLEYRTMGFGGGGSGTVSVPDKRIECNLAFIDQNQKVVWETSRSFGPSSVSFTRNGETDFATNVLNSRWKTFDGWIQNVRIPGLVRKFSGTGDFGSSMLQADGERIVKVSTE